MGTVSLEQKLKNKTAKIGNILPNISQDNDINSNVSSEKLKNIIRNVIRNDKFNDSINLEFKKSKEPSPISIIDSPPIIIGKKGELNKKLEELKDTNDKIENKLNLFTGSDSKNKEIDDELDDKV